jgi:predicted nicotinamide N-methyase
MQLEEYRLRVGAREWSVLHLGALISFVEEQNYLSESREEFPYGLALWPAAIALAHEIAGRGEQWRGAHVLELGAGTGLPGVVASALGAHVTQTDRQEAAMHLCRQNGERNRVEGIVYRTADWTHWDDAARYDWIVGADILYSESTQAHLQRIFETNLAAGGRLLLSDPFRLSSVRFLERLERDGWRVAMTRWTIGEGDDARRVGVFDLAR